MLCGERPPTVSEQLERTPRVLVVDDDESTVEAFARTLRLEGYEVITASRADAALEAAETSRPDAILLDLRMPMTDGVGFLRQLRARGDHRGTPVAVITGDHSMEDTVSRELRALNADVYFKPVWLDDLLRIVQHLLQKKA